MNEYRVAVPDILSSSFIPRGYESPQSVPDFVKIAPIDRDPKGKLSASGAEYYSVLNTTCTRSGLCPLLASDGTPIASDYEHLTPGGATDVVAALKRNGLKFERHSN